MNRRARVALALGEHRMIPTAIDDVIAYLIASELNYDARESTFRAWAREVHVPVRRSHLTRLNDAKRRELNRKLPF
jgi:hypothetical protein